MNMSDFNPSNGLLLVCERDNAKRLFSARTDEGLTEFFEEYLRDANNLTPERTLNLRSNWLSVHACFCGGKSDRDAGDLPLNQVILGGRQLGSGNGFQAVLVRPDFVPHIVTELSRFPKESADNAFQIFQSSGSESSVEFSDVWALIGEIGRIFESAAQLQAAVVFYHREN